MPLAAQALLLQDMLATLKWSVLQSLCCCHAGLVHPITRSKYEYLAFLPLEETRCSASHQAVQKGAQAGAHPPPPLTFQQLVPFGVVSPRKHHTVGASPAGCVLGTSWFHDSAASSIQICANAAMNGNNSLHDCLACMQSSANRPDK